MNLIQMTIISITVVWAIIPWRNGVALIVNKKSEILGCNLKNDRMISICLQGKPFNITVIQAYAPTSNAKEAETEWFSLETNRDHFVVFEIAPKHYISDSFLDYESYSISCNGLANGSRYNGHLN